MNIKQALKSKNVHAYAPIATRSYYPDHNKVLTHLMNLKADVKCGALTDRKIIKDQLISALRMSENLGVYYDYCDHPSFERDGTVYGARHGEYPIGGGGGYDRVEKYDYTVSSDDELYEYNDQVKPGQILCITDHAVIDLSDFLLAGDTKGYNGVRVPFEYIVKKDTAWVGNRGVGDFGGAILKMTSYSDCIIVVGENARLSGLVIQGPDREIDIKNHDQNFSCGIVVKGHNAVIENCEISGFYRTGISVIYSNNVIIRNNYIHDILGPCSGHAVFLEGSSVEMYGNLFSRVTHAVTFGFISSLDFHDNIDAGNIRGDYISILHSSAPSILMKNNTILSPVRLFNIINARRLSVENNAFAFSEEVLFYGFGSENYTESFLNNVYDVKNPSVLSSFSASPAIYANSDTQDKYAYVSSETLPALSSCYYSDTNDSGYVALRELIRNESYEMRDFPTLISDVIAKIGAYTNYISCCDKGLVSFVADGQRYGAYSDGDMIGGGYGYSDIITTGDYIVTNEQELVHALSVAKHGEVVFMPGDTYINLSDAPTHFNRTITVPRGVTLASDRGRIKEDGTVSTGAVIATSAQIYLNLILIGGEDVRLTGFVIKGADPARHVSHHSRIPRVMKDKSCPNYYYRLPGTYGVFCPYSNVEFDNLEVSGFNTHAIAVGNAENPPRNVNVHHCFIHHNQIHGLGYGVRIDSAFVNVTYNMFNYNRHSVASGGTATCSYIAENNIEMGESLDHYLDMHGGSDRRDGTIIAGGEIYMRYNSFLGVWRPFHQRGVPVIKQEYSYNVSYLPHDDGSKCLGHYASKAVENSVIGKNAWDIGAGEKAIVQGGIWKPNK